MGLLHDLLVRAAEHAPDRLAVVDGAGRSASFAALLEQAEGLAAWVEARTAPGDRVAIVGDNAVGYAAAYYGVPRCGRVLTLVNQRLAPMEQAAAITAAEPAVLLAEADHLVGLREVASQLPAHVLELHGSAWDEALTTASPAGTTPEPEDPAWLLFTSGSTGVPKGVVHTHRSLLAGIEGTLEGRGIQGAGVYYLPFPMCHIAGYNLLVHHAGGSTVVLAAQWRPAAFVAAVKRHGITSCSLAPTMLHGLLDHLDAVDADLRSLTSIAYGSAAISAPLIRRALDRLDVEFHHGYGMTEAAGNVTFLGPASHRRGIEADPAILTSVGWPHAGVELRVVDDAGAPLPVGRAGEVAIRGAQVMAGYWRASEETAATLVDGWLLTGDVGTLEEDGRLSIVDRRKDVIVSGGENIASREVEEALVTHPGVADAAVVAVPDDYWGEAVCAVVVLRGAGASAEELVAHVRARLAPFKRPRHVLVVDELPRTSNGKVAKATLRELARERCT